MFGTTDWQSTTSGGLEAAVLLAIFAAAVIMAAVSYFVVRKIVRDKRERERIAKSMPANLPHFKNYDPNANAYTKPDEKKR